MPGMSMARWSMSSLRELKRESASTDLTSSCP